MRSHLAHIHPETRRPRGRASKAKPDMVAAAEQVSCQRFFVSGSGSGFFSVIVPSPIRRQRLAGTVSEAEFIQVQVNRDLQERLSDEAEQGLQITTQKHATEVSPWLELTQWPKYLQGHSFSEVASLGMLPDSSHEPLLAAFAQSVERLIKRAHHTIQDRRINEFDQIRINSFVSRPRIWERPILVDLKQSTYARYQQVWQRLICFAYRSSRPDQSIILRHQLTTTQFAKLDRMEDLGMQLLAEQSSAVQDQLDHACLALSIALLDHPLKGDLFESTVIGFLAVLGVDVERQTFREPYGYTSYLSALVKMAQMLVVEQAVQMTDDGRVAHPADALDDMRERFLLYGVRAPFGWISRLRTYGKKVQSNTTSLGYIYWSDDEQTLSYKELRLTMTDFQRFARTQVTLAQSDLEKLFLLHEDEERETVVPLLSLHQLQDNPTHNQRGWNFLHDRRNRDILTVNGERWLMDRLLQSDSLRGEFLEIRKHDIQVVWRLSAVDKYLQQVDRFLHRLLLLVHITGGQPIRATELLSLRHSNTVHGRHRSIFIEHGLVSTVTAYHKGYSVSNSTKIIHRYLPKVVSELVVYYLWLILPFRQAIERLAHRQEGPPSPFLWPQGEGTWDSNRLRNILQREAQTHLQTQINILSYRHAAIAISRVHLKCSGFRRDYGTDDPVFNEQASHSSWTAATVYARGLQEAPGHIEARRRRYRAISREWHGFLGFEVSLGPRKRAYTDDQQDNGNNDNKMRRQK